MSRTRSCAGSDREQRKIENTNIWRIRHDVIPDIGVFIDMHHLQMIEWVQTFRLRKADKKINGTTDINRKYRNDKCSTAIENMKKERGCG